MCKNSVGDACYLILEDGTIFSGTPFGAKTAIDGEVGKFCGWQQVVGQARVESKMVCFVRRT